ncbi:MAG TPA: hypothetical protein VF972_10075 [Actinomycetota bacterium]
MPTDVPYLTVGATTLYLDIYVPAGTIKAMVLGMHGGIFQGDGDKTGLIDVATAFAADGYLTFCPNVRMYPDVYWPTQLSDAEACYAWIIAHCTDYGGDPLDADRGLWMLKRMHPGGIRGL